MCIISKERSAFCVQVEGMGEEIFSMSPIALQSRCKCVANEPNLMYGHSWPQHNSVDLNRRMTEQEETVKL
jgi:hypothetical protein